MATDEIDEQNFEQTPGMLLRLAREQQQLSIAIVAKHLNLSAQRIDDLENDRCRDTQFFIRGHLRVYAKLLGVPEQEILSSFEKMGDQKQENAVDALAMQTQISSFSSNQKSHHLARWATIFISVLLVVVLIFWWQKTNKQHNIVNAQKSISTNTVNTTNIQNTPTVAKKNTLTNVTQPKVEKHTTAHQAHKIPNRLTPNYTIISGHQTNS